MLLKHLLATLLPRAAFNTQVCLPNGVRVDATVYVGDRVVPIDSKFPQEALDANGQSQNRWHDSDQRALRRHIKGISEKHR